MTSFRTDRGLAIAVLLAAAAAAVAACGPAPRGLERPVGTVLLDGVGGEEDWTAGSTRYWAAAVNDRALTVANTPLGTGISPVWHTGRIPRDFAFAVRGSIEKVGLDGGWGIEFGARDRKFAYRVLLYASGRFCVDRLFGTYPEFIHCTAAQPEVNTGEAYNTLAVRVEGDKISISVNDEEVVTFLDDRYEPGEVALAVSGAGATVVFDDVVIVSLE